jgi:GNAT superfamily N-acetyltransferase
LNTTPRHSPDTSEPSVRRATPLDEPFVIGLAARFGSTRATWRGLEEVVAGTACQLAAAFAAGRADDVIFVALDAQGERVGFAYVVTHHDFFTGEPHGHISEIATVVDGTGVGSALMDAAEAWSRERGFRYLSLNVNDANAGARRFYERRAYVPEYRHLVKLLGNAK